jgi:hypothetical protein
MAMARNDGKNSGLNRWLSMIRGPCFYWRSPHNILVLCGREKPALHGFLFLWAGLAYFFWADKISRYLLQESWENPK